VCEFTATSPDRIAAVGGARTLRDTHDDLVRAHAPDLVERTAGAVGPTGLHVFSGQRGWLRRSYGDGWALVGDAASFKDPITAHGITDALRDAELLARVIEQGLGTTDEQAQLAAYQAERDRLSLPHFAIAGAIAAYDWDDDAIHALLLQLNSSMALEVEALLALEPRRPTVVVAPT
jgi:flavin-dependent dehydrogenase